MTIEPIAYIKTEFTSKFGIPRQSGLVENLEGEIHFTGEYKNPDYLRGIEGYSHLWLIWEFSDNKKVPPSPTVRPPRLGGNTRVGVFATRSPYRPNPLGLSCVKLESVEWDGADGPVLHVKGMDLLDGTPIYDIKPYVTFADSHPEARSGFAGPAYKKHLHVKCEERILSELPEGKRQTVLEILAQDPRPSYQKDPERIYGMNYAGYEIHFQVVEDQLTVLDIEKQ